MCWVIILILLLRRVLSGPSAVQRSLLFATPATGRALRGWVAHWIKNTARRLRLRVTAKGASAGLVKYKTIEHHRARLLKRHLPRNSNINLKQHPADLDELCELISGNRSVTGRADLIVVDG
jgi:hypothetical protein